MAAPSDVEKPSTAVRCRLVSPVLVSASGLSSSIAIAPSTSPVSRIRSYWRHPRCRAADWASPSRPPLRRSPFCDRFRRFRLATLTTGSVSDRTPFGVRVCHVLWDGAKLRPTSTLSLRGIA